MMWVLMIAALVGGIVLGFVVAVCFMDEWRDRF